MARQAAPRMDRKAPGGGPLYEQVRAQVIERLTDGRWRPGDCLPSEQALAAELGVSQGTLRKGIDALAADGVLERRQGRGTFVAETTPERSLYHFFRLEGLDHGALTPTPVKEAVRLRKATAEERAALGLEAGSEVHAIERLRALEGRPSLCETIVVPAALTPELPARAPLPNALYAFYEAEYGLSVQRAEERLRAVEAAAADAKRLGVAPGAPLLQIERAAFDLRDRPVERRLMRVLTQAAAYRAVLR